MPDTTTTDAVLSDAPWIDMEPGDLLTIERMEELKNNAYRYLYADMVGVSGASYSVHTSMLGTWELLIHIQSLQSRLDQAHWDAISRDQTIETLREENERLRDAVVQLLDSITECREDVLDQPHLLRLLWDLTADVLGEGVTP